MTSLLRKLAALSLCLPLSAFAASTISGTVTNKTTGKPSGNDDVVLIRLAQGMQESTRTKSDAKGRFKLDVPDTGIHLVRVTHEKANYFTPVPEGIDTVEAEVYDVAAKVAGVTGEADVMRIESDGGGNGLKVVENFFVKNDSKPMKTQFSDRPFEFYLPEDAIVQGSAALGPGGMPVQAAPVPLNDAKNHYTFIFPVRPGETRFQITYRLPYKGSFTFSPKPVLPTDTIAVMFPKSMTIKTPANSPFTAVTDEVNAQTYVARSTAPGQALEFTLSGEGQLPRDTQIPDANGQTGGPQPGASTGTAATDTRPGGGLGTPIDTPDPLTKYKWWIIGGLLLVMAGVAGFMLSKPAAPGTAPVQAAPTTFANETLPLTGSSTLHVLKEELFTLETDRLSGKISEEEYIQHKEALETVLKRALTR